MAEPRASTEPAPSPSPASGSSPSPSPSPSPSGRGREPGEAVVLFSGPARHTVVIGRYLVWLGVCLLGGVIAWALRAFAGLEDAPLWPLVFIGTPGIVWTYLAHVSTRYKVSTRRVEIERGVFSRDLHSLELWRVLDVGYRQSLLDRILGDGRIRLQSTDQSHPELVLHGLPDSRAMFERLRDEVQEARRAGRPMEMVAGDGVAELL